MNPPSPNKQALGQLGENLARDYFLKNKYELLESNFRKKSFEIDHIVKKNKTIYFVEVKLRTSKQYGSAAMALSRSKIQKLAKGVLSFLQKNALFQKFEIKMILLAIDFNKEHKNYQYEWIEFPLDLAHYY